MGIQRKVSLFFRKINSVKSYILIGLIVFWYRQKKPEKVEIFENLDLRNDTDIDVKMDQRAILMPTGGRPKNLNFIFHNKIPKAGF